MENEKHYIKLYANDESDLEKPFYTAVLMDDDVGMSHIICTCLADKIKNLLIVYCNNTADCLELARCLYFDVAICDINMHEKTGGEEVMAKIHDCLSPTTVRIAISGDTRTVAFRAGYCRPDFFIDKTTDETGKSMLDRLPETVQAGFCIARINRCSIYDFEQPREFLIHNLRKMNTYSRIYLTRRLGFAPLQYKDVRKFANYLGIHKVDPKLTMAEAAGKAGYIYPQRMHEKLGKIPFKFV